MAAMTIVRRWRSESGSQLIEFMLVFPLLMLLIAGIFDFGMLLRELEIVTNAAREGARMAVLDDYDDADVTARINQFIASSGLTGATSISVDDVPVTLSTGATFDARRVQVDYTYTFAALPGVAQLFGGTFNTLPLTGISLMRTESPIVPAP